MSSKRAWNFVKAEVVWRALEEFFNAYHEVAGPLYLARGCWSAGLLDGRAQRLDNVEVQAVRDIFHKRLILLK